MVDQAIQSPCPSGEGLGWGLSPYTAALLLRTSPTPGPCPEGEGRK